MNLNLGYSMIVAISSNGVIGDAQGMPWKQSADLKMFKKLTMGHAIFMGRKTYETIGKPLPGRTNIVLTRDVKYDAPGCVVVQSVDEARYYAMETDCTGFFVIGGAEVYRLCFPDVMVLHVTRIRGIVQGDTKLDLGDLNRDWYLTGSERHSEDIKNQYPYTFESYLRKIDSGRAS